MNAEKNWSLGLLGYPLSHSRSPLIHNAALRALNLGGEYRLYPVAPQDQAGLQALLGRLRQAELDGLNITIPHKQAVFGEIDRLTPTAQAVGAVNTLFMQAGELWGDNTDVPGFLADLTPRLAQAAIPAGRALVLGAGGSARAVVYALADGWQVSVAARRPEQAEALRPLGAQQVLGFNDLSAAGSFNLVVNTTPLGMHPNTAGSPWPDGLPLPAGAFIYDLVYNPAETTLLLQARQSGLAYANGLGMLVEQAALAFERWTGLAASRPAIYAALG